MSCCDETTARVPDTDMSRRSLFKGAAVIASVIPAARPARAQGKQIKLAYCSQLLCGPPYEVARACARMCKRRPSRCYKPVNDLRGRVAVSATLRTSHCYWICYADV